MIYFLYVAWAAVVYSLLSRVGKCRGVEGGKAGTPAVVCGTHSLLQLIVFRLFLYCCHHYSTTTAAAAAAAAYRIHRHTPSYVVAGCRRWVVALVVS